MFASLITLTSLSEQIGYQQVFILEHLLDSSRIMSGFILHHTSDSAFHAF